MKHGKSAKGDRQQGHLPSFAVHHGKEAERIAAVKAVWILAIKICLCKRTWLQAVYSSQQREGGSYHSSLESTISLVLVLENTRISATPELSFFLCLAKVFGKAAFPLLIHDNKQWLTCQRFVRETHWYSLPGRNRTVLTKVLLR